MATKASLAALFGSAWHVNSTSIIDALAEDGSGASSVAQTVASLAVTGNETVGGNLGVTGNTAMTGTLGVSGAATVTSLAVTGAGAIGGALAVTGALTVTGAAVLKGNVDIGDATSDTVGFYGSTKIAQSASAAQGTAGVTAVTTTSPWGFATSTQGDAVCALLNAIRLALIPTSGVGIMKGAA